MIIITQLAVILVALMMLFWGLGGRRTHIGRAWKKVGILILSIGMVVAVLFPETTNDLAHFVGVGRGADLLLYFLTLSFITYALNSYLHQQDDKDQLFRLARKIAIMDANKKYDIEEK